MTTLPHSDSDDNTHLDPSKEKARARSAKYAAKPESKAKQREYAALPESREKTKVRNARYNAKPETKVKNAERHARRYQEDPAYRERMVERHATMKNDPAYRAQRHEGYLNYISTPEGREKKRAYNARYREQKREYDAALRAKVQADPQLRAERNASKLVWFHKKREDPVYRAAQAEKARIYRINQRDHIRDLHLMKNYNLTSEDYMMMYERQNGCCAICNHSFKKLQVDHDHTSGLVRALVCHSCNAVLGLAKEDISILRGSIAYLEKYTRKDG